MYCGELTVVYWVTGDRYYLYPLYKFIGDSYDTLLGLKRGCFDTVKCFVDVAESECRNRNKSSRQNVLKHASAAEYSKICGVFINGEDNDLKDEFYLRVLSSQLYENILRK